MTAEERRMDIAALTVVVHGMARDRRIDVMPKLGLLARHLTMEHPLMKRTMEQRAKIDGSDFAMGGPNFVSWCTDHLDTIVRREAWRRVFPQVGLIDAPHHSLLAHPVHALAARTRPPATVNSDYDVARGMMQFTRGETRIEILSGDRAYLAMHGITVPETLLNSMSGRRLVEIVDLPRSGDPVVDEAVAMVEVEEGFMTGTEMRDVVLLLLPTPWVPLLPAPEGVDPDWWRRERYVS